MVLGEGFLDDGKVGVAVNMMEYKLVLVATFQHENHDDEEHGCNLWTYFGFGAPQAYY